jgi:hypothetical protein
MDEILKSFRIGFLLRGLFSGTFFVLAFYVTSEQKGLPEILQISSENVLSVGLAFALVAVVTIYGVHRSLIYPFIEWLLDSNRAKRIRKFCCPLISRNVSRNLIKRWDNKAQDKKKGYERARQLEVWADYIHLQFTSAWCIVFGSFAAVVMDKEMPRCPLQWLCLRNWHPISWPLTLIAVALVVAGAISNWRSFTVEEYSKKHPPVAD